MDCRKLPWPGRRGVVLEAVDGSKVKLPVPAAGDPPVEEKAWAPNPAQVKILESLEGKAMKSTDLKKVPGLENALFKLRGIKELQERELVKHDDQHGYYRPDAPPPELAGGCEGEAA